MPTKLNDAGALRCWSHRRFGRVFSWQYEALIRNKCVNRISVSSCGWMPEIMGEDNDNVQKYEYELVRLDWGLVSLLTLLWPLSRFADPNKAFQFFATVKFRLLPSKIYPLHGAIYIPISEASWNTYNAGIEKWSLYNEESQLMEWAQFLYLRLYRLSFSSKAFNLWLNARAPLPKELTNQHKLSLQQRNTITPDLSARPDDKSSSRKAWGCWNDRTPYYGGNPSKFAVTEKIQNMSFDTAMDSQASTNYDLSASHI